jgi:hypothetical protein
MLRRSRLCQGAPLRFSLVCSILARATAAAASRWSLSRTACTEARSSPEHALSRLWIAAVRALSFLFLKKKRVLARLQRATLQPPAIPNFAHTAFLGAPPTPQDPDNCAPSHETETSRLRVRGARILQKGQFRRFSSKLCNVGTQDCHVGF